MKSPSSNKKRRFSNDEIADLVRLEDVLTIREWELEKKSEEAAELKQSVSQLAREADAYRSKLDKLQKLVAELAGPTIEMIDPIILATRGIKVVPLKRNVTKRQIIGKVTSAVGVQGVYVNNNRQTHEKKGCFNRGFI